MDIKNHEELIAWWIEVMSSYDLKVEHLSRRLHYNFKGVNGIPCTQCGKVTKMNKLNVKAVECVDETSLYLKCASKTERKKIASESYFLWAFL